MGCNFCTSLVSYLSEDKNSKMSLRGGNVALIDSYRDDRVINRTAFSLRYCPSCGEKLPEKEDKKIPTTKKKYEDMW